MFWFARCKNIDIEGIDYSKHSSSVEKSATPDLDKFTSVCPDLNSWNGDQTSVAFQVYGRLPAQTTPKHCPFCDSKMFIPVCDARKGYEKNYYNSCFAGCHLDGVPAVGMWPANEAYVNTRHQMAKMTNPNATAPVALGQLMETNCLCAEPDPVEPATLQQYGALMMKSQTAPQTMTAEDMITLQNLGGLMGAQTANAALFEYNFCEDTTCPKWKLWLFLVGGVFTFMGAYICGVTYVNIAIRSTPENLRVGGLAIQTTIARLLGSIPGPILFGLILDHACVVWDVDDCGDQGNCLLFNMTMTSNMFIINAIVTRIISVICTALMHYWADEYDQKLDQQNVVLVG